MIHPLWYDTLDPSRLVLTYREMLNRFRHRVSLSGLSDRDHFFVYIEELGPLLGFAKATIIQSQAELDALPSTLRTVWTTSKFADEFGNVTVFSRDRNAAETNLLLSSFRKTAKKDLIETEYLMMPDFPYFNTSNYLTEWRNHKGLIFTTQYDSDPALWLENSPGGRPVIPEVLS